MSDLIAASAEENLRARALSTALVAWPLLAGFALCEVAIHLAGINHYGFFRDELYYMACGGHLAWGYIDQPPLVAILAWLAGHLFGNSLAAIRIFPVLSGAGVVYLSGWLARDMGGQRLAQALACIGILLAPAYLAFDSFFSMNAFEPLFWLVCVWLALRILKGASPRLWCAFGAVAGIGLENKHTMLVCGFGIVAGLLLSGEARLLRLKWIWIGGLIALAIFLPNLIWEARHGWPQIEVVRNAQRFKNVPVGPGGFLLDQVLFLNPLALPLWLGGLIWLFFSREAKHFRFLAWAYLVILTVFMALHGKSYYVLPIYPVLMAAGGVSFERFAAKHGRRMLRVAFPALLAASGLFLVPFGVPLLSVDHFLRYEQLIPIAGFAQTERDATVALPQLYADMLGWDQMAQTVARVYHSLPATEQADCAILAGNYGEAGAIDYYGPSLGLPAAISGHNSYYDWGPRNYSGACVILFGERAEDYKTLFDDVQVAGRIDTPHAMPGERNLPVYVCRKPKEPLAELWPQFRMII
ncbi:MAG TPA: glycosyltransferase family 39 protein [Candidatus Acidoferrales bacterium]|nr:glycosyltransferase family 39 protein [Candidatus Acidoferrales bacterium]